MSASWYDVLGVESSAGTDEIRAAWKASVADLDPTDRRFGLYNEAAGVLLDATRRSEYDASLAAEGPADATEVPDTGDAETEDSEPADEEPEQEERRLEGAGDGGVSAKLLATLAALLVVVAAVAAVLHVTAEDPEAVEESMAQARAAAETSVPKVIAYDYKFPERSHDQAMRVLTGDLRTEYDQLWQDVIAPNLEKSKATLNTSTLATGLVDSSRNGDRVDVLTILRVDAVNAEGTQNALVTVTVTMVRKDDEWLIVELDGWDPALSEEEGQESPSASPSASPTASTSPSGEPSASASSSPSGSVGSD